MECSRELKLKVVEFTPQQYLKLKDTLKALEYDERKTPVLALSGTAATAAEEKLDNAAAAPIESNARVLESHKELTVTDPHSAVFKMRYVKRILNYAGKIREAEVKIDYNPACQEAKFTRGVVISKTGQRQEISTNEMNVMDAGWNASAKRYTGGKILVANLPGVDIGSTIEVEVEVTSKGKQFLSGFESFQLPDELEKKSFDLIAPRGIKVQKMLSGEAGIVKEEARTENGNQAFHWRCPRNHSCHRSGFTTQEWVISWEI
jgi:hypothetical protein